MIEAAPIVIELMFYHKYTIPLLQASGCEIKRDASKVEITVILPPGSKREEYPTQLAHARTFLLTLPDQSVFYELYHLNFNSSTVSPPFYRYPKVKLHELF
ncbi:hypothetical protein KSF_010590 [Reticulibacter mediterranei]|uniref:Uncharacterized protein n=1 Tax=Reticulibacter mediterranei TaxID=2778369 RepID=A0A8J3IK18_9CHLR|nr:hypothetical protein KSF_010590 [Reticulibacter mediterranei]